MDAGSGPGRDLTGTLKHYFGFDRFREGQEEVVQALLAGSDTLVVMPTGSGKSLCYQLPAMVLPGLSLVISPLIALMKDQVEALQQRFRIPATFINSTLDWRESRERIAAVCRGEIKLLYVAPERLRDTQFLNTLQQVNLSMLAVDEAHCVSQWGHDFRPDYLRIGKVTRQFPQTRVMALTATATGRVREDIQEQLQLGRHGRAAPRIFVRGFERPNLQIQVSRCPTHDEKLRRVLRAIQDWQVGIIYCSTRKQVENLWQKLRDQGIDVPKYHGGMTDSDRERMQNRFMSGGVNLVVATNAFGMGVDRADVRFVLHWDIPGSMEAYYQEIGRAGRDGAPAFCELLYNFADVRTQEFFLEGSNPKRETVLELLQLLRRRCSLRPLALPAETWAKELLTTQNPMAVRTAMFLLERARCIQREPEPGSRSHAVLALEKIDSQALAEQLTRAEAKAARDRAKLDAILDYVNRRECRHKQILRYFGDATELHGCRACDICSTLGKAASPTLSEADWVAIQKILSTVARLNGQYGRARLAELLHGAKTKGILQSGLDKHRGYGLLQDWNRSDITHAFEELLHDGCLEQSMGEYPVLQITERGREAIWKRVTPRVQFRKSPPAPSAKAAPAAAGLVDESLLKRLKGWRMRRAILSKIKPYQVLPNKTLEAIAAQRPGSIEGLGNISGLGPVKLQRYGNELLKLLRE